MPLAMGDPPSVRLNPEKFNGAVAVVTGAANGIGKAVAGLFIAQGASVVLVDVDEAGLLELKASLGDIATRVDHRLCDLTSESEVHAMVENVIETHTKIDILVHMAGIYPAKPLLETTKSEYRRIFEVNMDSCFFLTQAVLPHMQKSGYGRIINTASQTIVRPEPLLSIYAASKGAVAAFTRATAVEAGPGITANFVSPTLIATEKVLASSEAHQWLEKMRVQQTIKRNGLPDDVAHAVMYLASPESAFITGQMFDVGGGAVFL